MQKPRHHHQHQRHDHHQHHRRQGKQQSLGSGMKFPEKIKTEQKAVQTIDGSTRKEAVVAGPQLLVWLVPHVFPAVVNNHMPNRPLPEVPQRFQILGLVRPLPGEKAGSFHACSWAFSSECPDLGPHKPAGTPIPEVRPSPPKWAHNSVIMN